MILLLGEAEVGPNHPSYEAGELHSVVATVKAANVQRAGEILIDKLGDEGFASVTCGLRRPPLQVKPTLEIPGKVSALKLWINILVLALLYAISILGASGCGEDDHLASPISREEPDGSGILAMIEYSIVRSQYTTPIENVRFDLSYPSCEESAWLGPIYIANGDEGREIEIATDFSFGSGAFFEMLTNGEDEIIHHRFLFNHMTFTYGDFLESESLIKGSSAFGSPDLSKTPPTRAIIVITQAEVECPGSDPNGDGNWADVCISLVVSFY